MSLHNKIMNLPAHQATEVYVDRELIRAYRVGHRDARHAAAELALAYDELLDACRMLVGARSGTHVECAARMAEKAIAKVTK
jgi:hypothetical protein